MLLVNFTVLSPSHLLASLSAEYCGNRQSLASLVSGHDHAMMFIVCVYEMMVYVLISVLTRFGIFLLHQAVVLSCSHLARRWAALERRSSWLVVDTQVKACSRETHSPCWAYKTYGHNAFQIIHIHTTVINSGHAHTTQHRTHCGL